MFERFYQGCRVEAAPRGQRKFRFKHKLLSLDATMIPLCLSVFDWALYRRSKGAVKLHLLLDHDGYLLRFAVVTAGMTSDIEVARQQRFRPGTMLLFDRVYTDMHWWLELSRQKVFFVTWLIPSSYRDLRTLGTWGEKRSPVELCGLRPLRSREGGGARRVGE